MKSKPNAFAGALSKPLSPAKPLVVTDEVAAREFVAREDLIPDLAKASSSRPPQQTPTKQTKARLTVYIPTDVDKRLRHAVVDDGADLSEAVTKAIEQWLAAHHG